MAQVEQPRRSYQPDQLTAAARSDGEGVKFLRGMRLYFAGPVSFVATCVLTDSLVLGFVVGMIVMFLNHAQLEQRHPYLSGLGKTPLAYVRDFIDKAKLALVLTLLGVFAGYVVFTWLREWLGVSFEIAPLLAGGESPGPDWQTTFLLALPVLICGDFCVYWYHRASHGFGESFLWRMHTVHHSIPHFTAAYGARAHPLETFDTYFWYGAAGGALGLSGQSTFAGAALAIFFMSAHHINADATIGPLKWILVNTEAHRWHHNVDYKNAGNYSLLFTIWDIIFGTRNVPHAFNGSMGINHFPREFPASGWAQTSLLLRSRYEQLKEKNR